MGFNLLRVDLRKSIPTYVPSFPRDCQCQERAEQAQDEEMIIKRTSDIKLSCEMKNECANDKSQVRPMICSAGCKPYIIRKFCKNLDRQPNYILQI